jgi:hypothetical protein
MLKRIVMLVSGLGMARCTQALVLQITQLWNHAKLLLVSYTRKFQSAVCQWFLYAKMVLSFKVWPAKKTIAEPLIKAELTTAKAKVMDLGKQRVTTARRTRRHAKHQPKKGK